MAKYIYKRLQIHPELSIFSSLYPASPSLTFKAMKFSSAIFIVASLISSAMSATVTDVITDIQTMSTLVNTLETDVKGVNTVSIPAALVQYHLFTPNLTELVIQPGCPHRLGKFGVCHR